MSIFNPADPKNCAYVPTFLLVQAAGTFLPVARWPTPDLDRLRALRNLPPTTPPRSPQDVAALEAAEIKRHYRQLKRLALQESGAHA